MFNKFVDKTKAFLYRSLNRGQLRKLQIFRDWFNTYVFTLKKEKLSPLGFKLVVGSYAANRQMQDGNYETEETNIIKKLLAEADVFVDVGANIGIYTCLARSLGKPSLAVEPQPRNLKLLYANLIINGWSDTEVYPLGLSKDYGLMPLYGASGPSASLVQGWAGYSKRFKQVIPLMTMDGLLGNRFMGKKLLIKIDVEGAEYEVMCGAQKTIDLVPRPTWFVEICLGEYLPNGINPNFEKIFDLFWKRNYKALLADSKLTPVIPGDINRWIKSGHTDTGIINYIFIPE